MSPATLKAVSYAHALDEFHAADAVADAAFEELADYGSRIELWGELEQRVLADLQAWVDATEKARSQAHVRLLYTFTDYLNPSARP